MRNTLTGLVLAACLLAPAVSDAQIRERGFENPASAPQIKQIQLVEPKAQQSLPFVQAYDFKIGIDASKQKRFKQYLEERLKISSHLTSVLVMMYTQGVIDYDTMGVEAAKETIYKTGLEALESGDQNIYNMIIKNTAWRNDILIGVKGNVLRNNLDNKYKISSRILRMIEQKNEVGRVPISDVLKARGTVADLKFLYDMLDVPVPKTDTD